MTFNFDKLTHRRGTNCMKWDEPHDDTIIPLWVADMDFETAPCIKDALRKRVEHGIFGYSIVPHDYYDAVINWFDRRHNWKIKKEWIQYTTGVVPATSAVIKALTKPQDKVLIQTPVYNCFFSSIRNNGCQIAENPLVYANQYYTIDFDDFEKKVADPQVKIFLLCNPHNPCGRVWTVDELKRMGEICKKYGIVVVSDEIHCEIVMPGYNYTPFAAISKEFQDITITLCSPSKSFNTAGLSIANIVSNNPEVQQKIDRAININEICDVNVFGIEAVKAAYNEGEEWLGELNEYIYGNYMELRTFFENNLPDIAITSLEGTYLVWADIRSTGMKSAELTQRLLDEAHVMVSSGTIYGEKAGEGFIRINLATQRSRLMEGLRRIEKVIKGMKN